jgi:hypothetical protein
MEPKCAKGVIRIPDADYDRRMEDCLQELLL